MHWSRWMNALPPSIYISNFSVNNPTFINYSFDLNPYYAFPNNRACSINFFAFFPRMFDLIRNSRLLFFEDRPTIKFVKKKRKKNLIKVGDEFRPKSPLWPGSSTYLMTLFVVVVVAIFLKKSSSADAKKKKISPDFQLLGDVQLFIFRHVPRMFSY